MQIDTRPLFRPLDQQLLQVLESLSPEDWDKPTSAKLWNVKDLVTHLLDGNLRALSIQRDKYFGETPPANPDYKSMVAWLNELNHSWVSATKRLSPDVLILLHKSTGDQVSSYYASLELNDPAIFPVDWTGESESLNWMHLAREYTEKWHHQKQIRNAVGVEGLMESRFFEPFMSTYMMGLPNTFRDVKATPSTVVKILVKSDDVYSWNLMRTPNKWVLSKNENHESNCEASIEIPAEIAWKLFSKNLRPAQVRPSVSIKGNAMLGEKVLEMVSVMA